MDETLKDIVDRIVQAVNPKMIYLFGSRARGDNKPDSDYDLTLIYDGELSKREVKLASRRSCWEIDASMDIMLLTSDELQRFRKIANTLEREITDNGVLIYE